MAFQGKKRSVTALLDAALTSPTPSQTTNVGVLATAADNAEACCSLLANGGSLAECWRFGILQTLDDYTSTLRRGGTELAARVFDLEPPRTGAVEVDAAFAALADYLAQRDGWTTPEWAKDPARRTNAWYPAVPAIFRADADRESPEAFRQRGILITTRSLARA